MEREILHVNLSWWFPEDEDLVALPVAVGGGWGGECAYKGRERGDNME